MRRTTHWDQEVSSYDRIMSRDPAMAALYAAILAHVGEPRRVLDLGTGTGELLSLIHARVPTAELVGLDPAPAMLQQAARRLEGASPRLVEGSAADLSCVEGPFDVIVSNFALHHLTHAEKAAAAREMYRVLAPNGRLVFGDQFIPRAGSPDDVDWLDETLKFFTANARHYLHTAGKERMLLQVRMLPRFLTLDGEIPTTVAHWRELLVVAGFREVSVVDLQPAALRHHVLVAQRGGA